MIKVLSILKNHFISCILISHINQKKNKKKNSKFKIFIIRFFYSFTFIRNLRMAKVSKSIKNVSYFEQPLLSGNVVNSLDNNGYFLSSIKKEIIHQISDEFKNNYFSYRLKDPKKNLNFNIEKNLNLDEIINKSNNQKIPHLTIDIDQNQNFLINKIGKSDFFLKVAKDYLNENKITMHTYCYISNPILTTIEEQKNNAQFFHYDCDYKKFIKIFVYLTEVEDENGPHIFVSGTHKKKKLVHLNSTRLDDSEIEKNYKNKIKKFIGKSGTIIFEDTFGFHKGQMPKNRSRAMLVYEYGVTPKILYDGSEIEI